MFVKIIEATNVEAGGINWGKFMVCQFSNEWEYQSAITDRTLLNGLGWTKQHVLVCDLQTGEGAIFRPGGYAAGDLDKHRVWVCPMFEPFLTWLYQQDLTDLEKLPSLIQIDNPSSDFRGYRRRGPD